MQTDITSVEDVLQIVKSTRSPGSLYRGQNVDRELLPKFARLVKELHLRDAESLEDDMVARFRKESQPYLSNLPISSWSDLEWLSVAQHHGLPTRLLDWTENPFAALWFAVQESKSAEQAAPKAEDQGDGVLWLLNFDDEDVIYPSQHNQGIGRLRRTRVFQPFHISPRIPAQSSWFSLHMYLREEKRFIPLEKNKVFKKKLAKFRVPRTHHKAITQQLLRMGVKPAMLFPDLGGLCQTLEIDLKFERLRVPVAKQPLRKGDSSALDESEPE